MGAASGDGTACAAQRDVMGPRATYLFSLMILTGGCFDDTDPVASDEDDETSADTGAANDDDDPDAADEADGETDTGQSEDDGESGDDTGEADGTAGDDGDAYPPSVTDHLDLSFPPDNYANPNLPAHFLTPAVTDSHNAPPNNPVTDAGATLGRVLFFDTNLSANGSVSCSSCHDQSLGFSDEAQLSEGFEGGLTGRHSMSLANAAYYAPGRFFWDERAETLEEQVLLPIQDEVEMGLTLDGLVQVVAEQPYYPELFRRSFGDSEITTERIAFALAQYVRAMVSYRSAFDAGLAQSGSVMTPFPNYSPQQDLGRQLFFGPGGNCGVCHMPAMGPPPPPGAPLPNQAIFMLTAPANNGLDAATDADQGAGQGRFKSPSLRNIELTGPYMHDGRLPTLAAVVDHYDSGVQPHPNLDQRLVGPDNMPQRLNLQPNERDALVEFLRTLTDDDLVSDPKFADPFLD